MDLPESRAVCVGALPALAHQVVDLFGAVGGLRQEGLGEEERSVVIFSCTGDNYD